MTGEYTYYIRCDGCGCVYRPSTALVPAPGKLSELRKLAAEKAWVHDIVQVYQGPGPSLDFCGECVATAVRDEAIVRVIEGKRRCICPKDSRGQVHRVMDCPVVHRQGGER